MRHAPLAEIQKPSRAYPAGTYLVRVEQVEEQATQQGARLMYSAILRIEEPAQYADSPLFENFVIGTPDDPDAEKAETWTARKAVGAQRLRELLEKAGATLGDDVDRAIDEAIDQHVLCVVQQRVEPDKLKDGRDNPYAGSIRNNISAFYAVGEREPGLVEDTDRQAPAPVAKVAKPKAKPVIEEHEDEPVPVRKPKRASTPVTFDDDE